MNETMRGLNYRIFNLFRGTFFKWFTEKFEANNEWELQDITRTNYCLFQRMEFSSTLAETSDLFTGSGKINLDSKMKQEMPNRTYFFMSYQFNIVLLYL